MPERAIQPIKIDRELVGPEITVGGHIVQPTARLTGQYAGANYQQGGWGGAWVRMTPVEAIVRGPDGSVRPVTMTDPVAQSLRRLWLSALLVAACCSMLILIARLTKPRG